MLDKQHHAAVQIDSRINVIVKRFSKNVAPMKRLVCDWVL